MAQHGSTSRYRDEYYYCYITLKEEEEEEEEEEEKIDIHRGNVW